ncbi:Uncharacterised protein [Vibrio cholerae]|nr:Uncharacterised protein [Vibrio cholerae]
MSKLPCLMVHSTMSTPAKWRLKSLVLWHSRKVRLKLNLFFLSR